MLSLLRAELKNLANPEKAVFLSRFFKTKEGEYGYGDIFLGIIVPQSRKIAIKYKNLPFSDITELLKSQIHEERLVALVILVEQFKNVSPEKQKQIYDFYLESTKYINNWDLVDLSADKIVGGYLLDKKDRSILVNLAHSKNMWERRIAIIATFQFIKEKEHSDTFKIAEILLSDKNDLIQKAVGWMLREVGKRVDEKAEYEFLDKHYKNMGRTALRYAIERFPEKTRLSYLKGTK